MWTILEPDRYLACPFDGLILERMPRRPPPLWEGLRRCPPECKLARTAMERLGGQGAPFEIVGNFYKRVVRRVTATTERGKRNVKLHGQLVYISPGAIPGQWNDENPTGSTPWDKWTQGLDICRGQDQHFGLCVQQGVQNLPMGARALIKITEARCIHAAVRPDWLGYDGIDREYKLGLC